MKIKSDVNSQAVLGSQWLVGTNLWSLSLRLSPLRRP
jgi:hypothetical protein